MSVSERVRNPGQWDAELPEQPELPTKDNVVRLKVRCHHCGRGYECAILPWSPVVAKSACPHCAQVNEVQTREPSMKALEEGFEHNHDVDQTLKHPREYSKDIGRKIATKLGDAYLIG